VRRKKEARSNKAITRAPSCWEHGRYVWSIGVGIRKEKTDSLRHFWCEIRISVSRLLQARLMVGRGRILLIIILQQPFQSMHGVASMVGLLQCALVNMPKVFFHPLSFSFCDPRDLASCLSPLLVSIAGALHCTALHPEVKLVELSYVIGQPSFEIFFTFLVPPLHEIKIRAR